MEKQIETLQQQLRQQEKMASLGLLSAGIAHEIQNPLNFVVNFSKMSEKLLDNLTDIIDGKKDLFGEEDREDLEDLIDDLRQNAEKIVEHSERAISIIQGILLVSRGKENERIPSDICRIVKEYVWLSYHAMRASHKGFNISIHESYQEGIPLLMVIPQDLSRAVLNLMNNACYAVWHKSQQLGDSFAPAIDVTVCATADTVSVAIKDNGEGMSEEVQQRIYENFFTTKPIGQGTGLGMAITRDIIEQKHGGRLGFTSQLGEGTCFTFTIPIKQNQ